MDYNFLRNKISINNRYLGIVNNKQLLDLNIELPEIQRIVDDDNVNEIVNYQINFYKENKRFNFLGVINIHYVIEKQKFFLIDGQHRYKAIQNLFEKGHCDIDIVIEIVEVYTYNELKNNYKLINKNTQLPEFSEDIDKSIPEQVAMYYKNKYPTMWSKTSRAHRPNLYFSFFQEALGILTEKLEITEVDNLKNIIDEYNLKLSTWDTIRFPENKTITKKIINKCKETGLFLGLFKYTHDDIGYKWVKEIIYNNSGILLKTEKKGKKKIPKKIKDDSWDKYIGKEHGSILCICCNKTEIQQKNFIGGHIISEKNGGEINIDNIIPICNECNLSMGSKNMDTFIKEYYPNNITNFYNRGSGEAYSQNYNTNNQWSFSKLF